MSVRPYRDIHRRKSRQIHVGKVPVGGDAPITVQIDDQHAHRGRRGDDRADPGAGGGRRRHRARLLPRRGVRGRAQGDRARGRRCRSSPTSISTTSARSRRPRPAPRACASIPAISARPGARARGGEGGQATTAARCASASMPARSSGICWSATASPAPRRMVESALNHAKILEDNDFHEFKISVKASDVFLAVAAYQRLAEACDYPLHLGITEAGGLAHRHRQIGDRHGLAALGRHRRHDPRLALGRSGRGDQGRLRHAEVAAACAAAASTSSPARPARGRSST